MYVRTGCRTKSSSAALFWANVYESIMIVAGLNVEESEDEENNPK
jgi:hypothetical protein